MKTWIFIAAVWLTGPIAVRVKEGPMELKHLAAVTAIGPIFTVGFLMFAIENLGNKKL